MDEETNDYYCYYYDSCLELNPIFVPFDIPRTHTVKIPPSPHFFLVLTT